MYSCQNSRAKLLEFPGVMNAKEFLPTLVDGSVSPWDRNQRLAWDFDLQWYTTRPFLAEIFFRYI